MSILLGIFLVIILIPIYAQEERLGLSQDEFEDVFVSSTEYTKLMDRLNKLEHDSEYLIIKSDALQNLNLELNQEIENLQNKPMILDSMDFLENLVLVIIPVVSSIIGSKLIINSWQMKKEKSELRKSILQEFDQTHSKLGQFMFEMFYKIRYSYIDLSNVHHDKIATDELVIFPTEKNEQPLSRFHHLLEELQKKQSEFNTADTNFHSTIMIYFDNTDDFFTELHKCNELGFILYMLLHEIIYSTNESDFKKLCKKFTQINKEHQQKIAFIKIMIIYEKIKNPDKGMSQKFIEGFTKKSENSNF